MTVPRPKLRTRTIPHLVAIVIGAAGCVGVAFWAKNTVEADARTDLKLVMSQTGHDWVNVHVDGLSVTLEGTAPDEATRFSGLPTNRQRGH